MASALQALSNATAIFSLPAAGTVTDARGNVIPATETVTVTLYLRQGGIAFEGGVSDTDLPGIEAETQTFEGYAVNPQELDPRIIRGTVGTLSLSGDTPRRCEVADVGYPYGTAGLIGETVLSVLGTKIRILRYLQK